MRIWLIAMFLVLLGAGCGGRNRGNSAAPGARSVPPGPIDPARLQAQLMDFSDSYVTTISDACDQLAAEVKSPAVKRAALMGKLGAARGAFINASNPNPVAGLMDMLVLVTLQSQSSN